MESRILEENTQVLGQIEQNIFVQQNSQTDQNNIDNLIIPQTLVTESGEVWEYCLAWIP